MCCFAKFQLIWPFKNGYKEFECQTTRLKWVKALKQAKLK